MLVDALHAAAVVVGANFRFGNRAAGDVATLREAGEPRGFVAEGIPLDGGPQVWSSTYVRNCLAAGDVAGAAEALGRPFTVRGVVVKGDQRGRELGFPTANVPTGARRRGPADGVYAGWLRRLDTGEALPGRDQRRHQPDLRRRARPPGRELRARPRPTSSCTASRSRSPSSTACAGWSRSTSVDDAGRADERRRRPRPRAARRREAGAPASRWPTTEAWFLAARAALLRARGARPASAARCGPAAPCRCVAGGRWWRPAPAVALALARPTSSAAAAAPCCSALGRWWRSGTRLTALQRPADRRVGAGAARSAACGPAAADHPGAAAAAALRHVPVHQHRGLAGRVGTSTAACSGWPCCCSRRSRSAFLLVRLPEELDRADDEVDDALLLDACRRARRSRRRAASYVDDPDATRRRTPRSPATSGGNLVLVLLVTQAVQVLLLAVGGLRVLRRVRRR